MAVLELCSGSLHLSAALEQLFKRLFPTTHVAVHAEKGEGFSAPSLEKKPLAPIAKVPKQIPTRTEYTIAGGTRFPLLYH